MSQEIKTPQFQLSGELGLPSLTLPVYYDSLSLNSLVNEDFHQKSKTLPEV